MSGYLALSKYQWEELERIMRDAKAGAWDDGYLASVNDHALFEQNKFYRASANPYREEKE